MSRALSGNPSFYCVVKPTPGTSGAVYGCSTNKTLAQAALARAVARGQTGFVIQERAARPRGVVGWLAPTHER